jgi:hypothetical protein
MSEDNRGGLPRPSRLLSRLLKDRADGLMGVSKTTAEQLTELSPKASSRVVVARIGVDRLFFDLKPHGEDGAVRKSPEWFAGLLT